MTIEALFTAKTHKFLTHIHITVIDCHVNSSDNMHTRHNDINITAVHSTIPPVERKEVTPQHWLSPDKRNTGTTCKYCV